LLGKLGPAGASELAKFGLNLNTAPGGTNTLSEKWEALGLVPIGGGSGPFFLFVGNDNDFLSSSGKLLDASGVLQSYDAGLENDTMVLAFGRACRFGGAHATVGPSARGLFAAASCPDDPFGSPITPSLPIVCNNSIVNYLQLHSVA